MSRPIFYCPICSANPCKMYVEIINNTYDITTSNYRCYYLLSAYVNKISKDLMIKFIYDSYDQTLFSHIDGMFYRIKNERIAMHDINYYVSLLMQKYDENIKNYIDNYESHSKIIIRFGTKDQIVTFINAHFKLINFSDIINLKPELYVEFIQIYIENGYDINDLLIKIDHQKMQKE